MPGIQKFPDVKKHQNPRKRGTNTDKSKFSLLRLACRITAQEPMYYGIKFLKPLAECK